MIMGSLEGSVGSFGGFCVGASVIIEHQRLSGLGNFLVEENIQSVKIFLLI